MSTIKEYSTRGVREFRTVKGCHECFSCENLKKEHSGYYSCSVRNKNTLNDRKFPYDNTRCKEFEEKYGKR